MANAAGELAAAVGICAAHGNGVLLDPISFLMAQMTVVQIICVAIVCDCRVPAIWTVCVRMFLDICHSGLLCNEANALPSVILRRQDWSAIVTSTTEVKLLSKNRSLVVRVNSSDPVIALIW
jgi:hypothetical protein